MVTTQEGEALSHRIRANRFIECSAKGNVNIESTIHEAVRAAVKGPIIVEARDDQQRSAFECSCCPS